MNAGETQNSRAMASSRVNQQRSNNKYSSGEKLRTVTPKPERGNANDYKFFDSIDHPGNERDRARDSEEGWRNLELINRRRPQCDAR
jgi:hypothetical protein